MFLLKFWSIELIGWGIKLRIQRVPTWHTSDGPYYPKNMKYLKKCDDDVIITFFQVFLVFRVAWSVKSISSGYSLDREFNYASNELSRSKFEWTHREICRKYEQKSSFLFLGYQGPSKVCRVGTRWMQNSIFHPATSSPDQNLSKHIGRYVENTNKKGSFFLFFIQNY